MGNTLNQKPLILFFPSGEKTTEKPVIYIDSREASSSIGTKIANKLIELGAAVKLVKLEGSSLIKFLK